MKDLKYEHQSGWGGCRVGGWRVHGVGVGGFMGCVVVWVVVG